MFRGSLLRSTSRTVAGGVRAPLSTAHSVKPAGRILRVSSPRATSPCPSNCSPTFVSSSGSASDRSFRFCLLDGEDEWEPVESFVFGQAPTREEVEDAASTLQQIIGPVVRPQGIDQKPLDGDDGYDATEKKMASLNAMNSDFSSEGCQSDWMEPAVQLYSSNYFEYTDQEKVLGALQLFKTSSTLQNVVASISSDRAVWDAVMNNATVQELKTALCDGASESNVMGDSDEQNDTKDTGLLLGMFHNAKAKIGEFIERIIRLTNAIFRRQNIGQTNANEAFDGVVRSSLMISIMVFVIVILKRLQK